MELVNIQCKDCKNIDWNKVEYHKTKEGFVRFGCKADNIEGKTPWIYTKDDDINYVVCNDYVKEVIDE